MRLLCCKKALNTSVKSYSRQSSISALQAAFRDPSSPFHIPPGSKGPESPNPPALDEVIDPLEEAYQKLTDAGFDPASFWEQRIAWGDQDPFQHVNNVQYVRFFESSRIKWMMSIGHELGGPSKAEAMMRGQGVSLILKSIEIRFRRPVTFPDTLVIGYRPLQPTESVPPAKHDPATFTTTASAYSLSQRVFVAHSNDTLVWYDYDRLKKCDPSAAAREAVWRRAKRG